MNIEYEARMKKVRKEVSRLTLQKEQQLVGFYNQSIKNLAKRADAAKVGSLDEKFKREYLEALEEEKKKLQENIEKLVDSGVTSATKITTEAQKDFLLSTGINELTTKSNFNSMFLQVQDKTVRSILDGDLYTDNKTLSDRVWDMNAGMGMDIQYQVGQALLEKQSSQELAADLEQFLQPPSKRQQEWAEKYPRLAARRIDYRATRLARTSMQHAYQTATIQSTQDNPFVDGIRWQSALIQGRTCDICRERHGKVYKKNKVPLDHPNGLCTMIPEVKKSSEEIAEELKDWVNGESNPALDKWANKMNKLGTDFKKLSLAERKRAEKAAKQKKTKQVQAQKVQTKKKAKQVKKKKAATKNSRVQKAKIKRQDIGETTQQYKERIRKQINYQGKEWKEFRGETFVDSYNDWIHKITEDEQEAIEDYTGPYHKQINQYLRGQKIDLNFGEFQRAYTEEEIKAMAERVTGALSKSKTTKSFTTLRGVSERGFARLFPDAPDIAKQDSLYSKSWLQNQIESGQIKNRLVEDSGLLSTSPYTGEEGGAYAKEVMLNIEIPEGTEGAYVAPISSFRAEREFLINPGYKMQIVDAETKKVGKKEIVDVFVRLIKE